jgi:hypothetical protein
VAYSSSFRVTKATLVAGAAAAALPASPLANRNLLKLVPLTDGGTLFIGESSSVDDTTGAPIPTGQPGTDFMPIASTAAVFGFAPAGGPDVDVAIWEYAQ